MTIAEMQKQIFNTAVKHGWWPMKIVGGDENFGPDYDIDVEKVNIPEKIALMHSELSEALEFFRTDQIVTFASGDSNKPKPDGFWIELADCMIRILDLAEAYGEDMEQLIELKMKYNETRAYKHGGKRC